MVAKHRFDRPAIIHSVCVHEVARLESEARRFSKKEKWEEAFELHKQAYERSGRSTSSKLKRFFAFVDAEKTQEVRDWADGLMEDPEVGSVYRATIREIIADLDLEKREKRDEVNETYLKLADFARDDSERRRLQVKAHLVTLEEQSVNNILKALAARPGPDSSLESTLFAIAESAKKRPDDPVIAYLAARQYFNHGDFTSAVTGLKKADSLGLGGISEALDLESHMLRGRALFYMSKYDEAKEVFSLIASDDSRRLGAVVLAKDWQERCNFRQN
jgi:tetratricopeptide (TPR) repeat protein